MPGKKSSSLNPRGDLRPYMNIAVCDTIEGMARNIVIYIGGGAMLGIFGGGVVTALEQMKVRYRIKAVYGASAGALDGAYFLAGQTTFGSTIYLEDLTKNFIVPENMALGVVDRIQTRLGPNDPKKTMRSPVDIRYAFNIVERKKPLDIEAVFSSGIDFYIEILNIKTCKTEYVRPTRENILDLLETSASPIPYWCPSESFIEKGLADGSIEDPTGLDYLLKTYPDEKILLIINIPDRNFLGRAIKNFIEGMVASDMFGKKELLKIFAERDKKLRRDIARAKKIPRVTVVQPPASSPTMPITTNPAKLITTYDLGKEAGYTLRNFFKDK